MRVLITGAAGFIGSHLADALLEADHDVYGVDNFTTGNRDNFPHFHAVLCEGDIADGKWLGDIFQHFEPDVVVHAAASYKNPDDWRTDTLTNVLGTANVVRYCEENSVGRLIYFQTALCYGTRPESPVSVDAPLAPDSSYAITKTAGERYIMQSDLDWISFRLANIYGPRNLSGPVPAFYKRLKAGETCTVVDTRRDFVYIGDLVPLVVRAIEGEGESDVYHVSCGRDIPISDIFFEVCEAMGSHAPPKFVDRSEGDASTILLDPIWTTAEFLWHATTELPFGIRQAVNWYAEHGVGDTYTHLKLAA